MNTCIGPKDIKHTIKITHSWDDVVEECKDVFSPLSLHAEKHVVLVPLSHAL